MILLGVILCYVFFTFCIWIDLIVVHKGTEHTIALWTSLLIASLWPMWAVSQSKNVFRQVDQLTKESLKNLSEKENSDDIS